MISTGTLGEKKANVKPDFCFALLSPLAFPDASGSDIQTFHGFPSRTLYLSDCRGGRGHRGRPFPSSVLFSRIARSAVCQVAEHRPRTSAVRENPRPWGSGLFDLSVPLRYGNRHWTPFIFTSSRRLPSTRMNTACSDT